MTTPLYVIVRRAGGEKEMGVEDGGGEQGEEGEEGSYDHLEAVDVGGDTVMCCCDGGDGPDECRLRGFLRDKAEAWGWGREVDVEFTEGDVEFLRRAMRDSYVSSRSVEVFRVCF